MNKRSFQVGKEETLEQFECEVRQRDNPAELKKMTIQARSKDECARRLLDQGFLVVSIKQSGQQESSGVSGLFAGYLKGRGSDGASKGGRTLFSKGVTTRELIFFAVQLSTLLKAGIPLIRSLEIIRKGTPNPYFQSVIQKLSQSVAGGSPLGVGLKNQGKVFPWVWVNLVEVGEATGRLPESLEEIAKYQESAARIKAKILTAFFYPTILAVAVVAALAFLLIFIVPKFAEIFAQQNMTLPAITQVVISLSNIVKNQAYLLLLAFIPFIILGYLVKTSPQVRLSFDLFRLNVPLFGPLLVQITVVRFSRALSTLLKSGVQILQALEICGRLVENAYMEAGIKEVIKRVRTGQGLGAQLEARKLFPVFMTQLVTVGEETGQIDKFLDLLGVYYEERVDAFLARLTSMLEPIMLVFMGGVIGVIVVSMFLPIIELSTRGGVG
ncbi:MAG TPA: type II secretion system F family protein [Candidatus Omnitrophota bacterium]|nr:type II secretion system F family protein [Candidatus Omnitrophota bacterium]